MLVYLASSEISVSIVLVRENKGIQSLIYYVNESLLDIEIRYLHLEKLALELIVAAQKLYALFSVSSYVCCHDFSIIEHPSQTKTPGINC